MRLRDVARRFNRTTCRDAYTGAELFYGQVLPWDEVRRDAVTYERRVLSVDPSENMPVRRVIQAAGDTWVIGSRNVDEWMGEEIRHGYTLQQATTLASLLTLEQAVNGLPGTQSYCGRSWTKNAAFTQQSSDLAVQSEVYLGVNESTPEGSLIDFDGDLLVVRAFHTTEPQMLRATCESLGTQARVTAAVTHGTRDPVTEQVTGATVSTTVIRIRWQALYAYGNPQGPSMEADDQQLALSSIVVPQPVGAKVVMPDSSQWLVRSATRWGSAWLCRATRHA